MKNIILSPEFISAISSLITAIIGLLIRKIEKTTLDNKIKELENTQQDKQIITDNEQRYNEL